MWDLSTGFVVHTITLHRKKKYECPSICFSDCGTMIAICGNSTSAIGKLIQDYQITVWKWNTTTWAKMARFQGHTKKLTSVRFSKSGDKIVSTSMDGSARIWSIDTKTEVLKITVEGLTFMHSACFDETATKVAVPIDEILNIYDVETKELTMSLSGHTGYIRSVDYSQDGRLLVSGSEDATIIIWDVATGHILRNLVGHDGGITCVRFNQDATRIVSTACDEVGCIWDVSTGEILFELSGHNDFLLSCCFSRDGSKVITGCYDRTVKVWDSNTGEEVQSLSQSGYVRSVCCQPSELGSFI